MFDTMCWDMSWIKFGHCNRGEPGQQVRIGYGRGNTGLVDLGHTVNDPTIWESQTIMFDIDDDGVFPEKISTQNRLSYTGHTERMPCFEPREVQKDSLCSERVNKGAIRCPETLTRAGNGRFDVWLKER